MQEFDCTIAHVSGRENILPDTLSHQAIKHLIDIEEMPDGMFAPKVAMIQDNIHLLDVAKRSQRVDTNLQEIIQALTDPQERAWPAKAEQSKTKKFDFKDDTLFKQFGNQRRLSSNRPKRYGDQKQNLPNSASSRQFKCGTYH